jgi:hypothetical protein
MPQRRSRIEVGVETLGYNPGKYSTNAGLDPVETVSLVLNYMPWHSIDQSHREATTQLRTLCLISGYFLHKQRAFRLTVTGADLRC